MLDVSHNPLLVVAAFAVALMAGFTGFSLTAQAAGRTGWARRRVQAMAALVLGIGIWAMHFVAMLGLMLPIPFFYDGATTLLSALVAIVATGIAVMLLQGGGPRTRRSLMAGAALGLGIAAMHYGGMSAMKLCTPVTAASGVVLALLASVALSTGALHLAHDTSGPRALALATMAFAAAVFCVHFIAIAGTGFIIASDSAVTGASILSHDLLAAAVILVALGISGAFLFTGTTLDDPAALPGGPDGGGDR